jgi:hypothetical protein
MSAKVEKVFSTLGLHGIIVIMAVVIGFIRVH